MADEEPHTSVSSASGAAPRERRFPYQRRGEDGKKMDATMPRPPWEAELKSRHRPAPRHKPEVQTGTQSAPKWGAPSLPKKPSAAKDSTPPVATRHPTSDTTTPTTAAGPSSTSSKEPVDVSSDVVVSLSKQEQVVPLFETTVSISTDDAPVEPPIMVANVDPVESSSKESDVSTEEDPVEATFTLGFLSPHAGKKKALTPVPEGEEGPAEDKPCDAQASIPVDSEQTPVTGIDRVEVSTAPALLPPEQTVPSPKPTTPTSIPTTPPSKPTTPPSKPTTPTSIPTTPPSIPTTPPSKPTTPTSIPTTPTSKPSTPTSIPSSVSPKPTTPIPSPKPTTPSSKPTTPSSKLTTPSSKLTTASSKQPEPRMDQSLDTEVNTYEPDDPQEPSTSTEPYEYKEVEAEYEYDIIDATTVKAWEMRADDDSEMHQVKLAHHYMSLVDSDIDSDANGPRALHWMIKASKHGNQEATELLLSVVERNLPWADQSKNQDITWCLNSSNYERRIRHAALTLFRKINTKHKDTISHEEYVRAVQGLTGKVKEQTLLMAAGRKIGDKISENEFVTMLSKRIKGTLTWTNKETEDSNAAYASAGYVGKVFRHPRQTACMVFDSALEYSSNEGLKWVVSLIPVNQMYVLGMLFFYSLITLDVLYLFVPLFVFYLSFATLIICTLQMLYKKKKQMESISLAGVLRQLDVSIDLDDTASQYSWHSLTPYIIFFSNLPLVVCSFALCNKSYIPTAEISVIALMMTGLTFLSLNDIHEKATLFVMFDHLLASLPVLLHNFPDIPLVHYVISAITTPLLVLELGSSIKFNISYPSIAYAMIPLFFIRMAMTKSWQGTYRVLVPHLVCYFWFNIVTSTFPFTTWFGLCRATIGYLLLPLLIPISVVGIVLMFVFAAYKAFHTQLMWKICLTAALVAVPLVMSQYRKIFGRRFDIFSRNAKKVLMLMFGIIAVFSIIFVNLPNWQKEMKVKLPYENYTSLCFREKIVNDVPQQVTCSHLIGTKVNWTGTVESVAVKKIENSAEDMISSLPLAIANPLYCMFGLEYPQCDPKLLSKKGFTFCTVMRGLGRRCHVKNLNVYQFEVLVLTGSQNIKIDAGNSFKETVLALEIGDTVEYMGTLTDNLGGTVPRLKLSSLTATNRELPVMKRIDEDNSNFLYDLEEAMAVTFNFMWYPVLEYTV